MNRPEDAKETHDRIIRVISSVPEKKLMLVQLARELWGEHGPDWAKVQNRQPDINLATAEVDVYTRNTQRAARAIWDLPAR